MALSLPSEPTEAACCYRTALDSDAGYCGDCGKPVFRCMAYEECGGLLDSEGRCPICIAPELYLEAGAVKGARVGGAMSLPLIVRNASTVGRPLFITGMWSREGNGDWSPIRLPWERLEAEQSAPIAATADRLDKAGSHSLSILISAVSRWRWREEAFAFTSNLNLTIEADDAGLVNNVNISGEKIGAGAMVHIVNKNDGASAGAERLVETKQLELTRADNDGRSFGLRGMGDGTWVPRTVRCIWKGFGDDGAPADGPLVTSDGVLSLGRAKTKLAGGSGDARLLVYGRDGALDEGASRAISRHHFDLYIESNRLMLRVNSENGVRLNGKALGRSKAAQLCDGDVIEPLVKAPNCLAIHVRFEINHGSVDAVTFTRKPAVQSGRSS